ncbi:MAG TPA: multiheme c-type cytochrome [Myxococcota bacterium]|nr:multiheme c-type cytochrome [Myxococcota bacterium]
MSSGKRSLRARATRAALCAVSAWSLLTACGDEVAPEAAKADAAGKSSSQPAPAAAPTAPAAASAAAPAAKPERRERPLPAFGGWTLDNKRLEVQSLLGKRLVVFFFNPEVDATGAIADAVASIAKVRGPNNFEILGVAVGASGDAARAFVKRHGLDFPVIDDSAAKVAGQFGLRTPMALLGVDSEGYVVFGMAQFPTDAGARASVEQQLRQALRLPEPTADTERKPLAPTFTADVLDGARFDLAKQRGHPVILLFFLHTCPHCHEFLEFLKKELASYDPAKRPLLVGIELTGRAFDVRERMKTDGLDFFPVMFDESGKIRESYGVFGAVPDVFLIDAQGRIAAHTQGFAPDTDVPLIRMRLALLAGTQVPMLLRKTGFSGNEACGVCHETQHDTWQLTAHAGAFDTLVRHGADSDAECVRCHVVGFGHDGGYEIGKHQTELEGVGCEDCHGRGGPHLSPGTIVNGDYSSACAKCHDDKHSLGFEYAAFLPRVSHAANAQLLALPAKERDRILAERGTVRAGLLPTTAAYVGSQACQSCHPAEHAKWSAGPHATAIKALAKTGREADMQCVACHTTGFGKNGGFPSGARVADHPDLASVGCESCHGPGGNHVGADAPKRGTILALGDKCDSCVILQICGTCHDQANDPGFEFEVMKKIEATRHGTIEAGTGKPLKPGDRSARADADPHALLAAAFAVHDESSREAEAGR